VCAAVPDAARPLRRLPHRHGPGRPPRQRRPVRPPGRARDLRPDAAGGHGLRAAGDRAAPRGTGGPGGAQPHRLALHPGHARRAARPRERPPVRRREATRLRPGRGGIGAQAHLAGARRAAARLLPAGDRAARAHRRPALTRRVPQRGASTAAAPPRVIFRHRCRPRGHRCGGLGPVVDRRPGTSLLCGKDNIMAQRTRRPLIGVTAGTRTMMSGAWAGHDAVAVNEHYVRALRAAGARPVTVAPQDEWTDGELAELDGLGLAGGTDLDPAAWGEGALPTDMAPDPERDAFETGLYRAARRAGVPVLGICRGLQIIVIAE